MQVRDAMRKLALRVAPGATLREAAALMDEAAVGALVVVDDDRVVGIVTDRDLVVRAIARGLSPDVRVDAVMSTTPVCIDEEADLHDAVLLFGRHPFRRLPVVRGSVPVGMITVDDLLVDLTSDLQNLTKGLTAQVLFGHPEAEPPATT